jgi:hypothetical protein
LTAGTNNKKNAFLSNSLQNTKHALLWDAMRCDAMYGTVYTKGGLSIRAAALTDELPLV